MNIIHGYEFKMHLILDNSIFQNVLKDLKVKFENVLVTDEKPLFVDEGKIIWDAGGSILGNDIKFSFRLSDDISLICRSQHWDAFKNSVASMVQKERNGYFKLHSHMFVLCITEEQALKIMNQIIKSSGRFDQIASTTLDRIPVTNLS